MSATTAVLSDARRRPRLALILALLGLPGSTIAWDLPAGGFWIGMPLAVAAVVVGLRVFSNDTRVGRRMAVAAIAIAAVEILFTATWTVAG
jgi:phosphatidylserine synthase